MSQRLSVRIDGDTCMASPGQSLLEVARENGKFVPTLCFLEGLSVAGSCRLCLVELEGMEKPVPSCTTLVRDGMVVATNSERLAKHRLMVLEMLFVERNHYCAVCVSNGHCELQSLATRLGMTHVNLPYSYPRLEVDLSHPRFVLDHNRCILCSRCVRVCDEVEGAHVWDIGFRGTESRLVADLNRPWGESQSCTSCGKCVQVCPTGALAEKGFAVEEMVKRSNPVKQLAARKGTGQ